jgi:serine protease Do
MSLAMQRVFMLAATAAACSLVALPLVQGQEDVRALEEQAIKAAVADVAASVLKIETVGGLEQVGRLLVSNGPTTGVVVSSDGYIVSSAFNFVQQPSAILVTLPDGNRATATIVASDRSRMLVLLKVNTDQPLTVPRFVPREEMTVGQWTLAVGRTFAGPQPNVSVGILSATNRIWGKAIQTDARVSPINYGGPLVDIQGRVLGVLVPLSPQRHDEIAGAEWYDSGIGFAIPLVDVMARLETLKSGQDLQPGILGVALKGSDIYADPAEIAACLPKSPASLAGLKPGDQIVEIDGASIGRQAELKHAIGPRYAGDQLQIVALRDDQRLTVTVELTDKLEPYENPFLGILPDRSPADQPGVVVRYVYAGSPADEAGVKPDDRLTAVADRPVENVNAVLEVLAGHEPGEPITLTIQRDGQTAQRELTLGSLPTSIPDDLPPARQPVEPFQGDRPAVGAVDIRVPEEANECLAYIPDDYQPTIRYGLVVLLDEPGTFQRDQTLARWKEHCLANDLILLAPQPIDPKRWQATEVDVIRKTVDLMVAQYNVDPLRVVACGNQAGGAMALLTAFTHRDLIRGVAANNAPLPNRLRIPPNEPLQRLALFLTVSTKSPQAKLVQNAAEQLTGIKYPVIVRQHQDEARVWTTDELSEIVRWIDTLDRM